VHWAVPTSSKPRFDAWERVYIVRNFSLTKRKKNNMEVKSGKWILTSLMINTQTVQPRDSLTGFEIIKADDALNTL
jgi:hypothetical protein